MINVMLKPINTRFQSKSVRAVKTVLKALLCKFVTTKYKPKTPKTPETSIKASK